MAGCVSLIALLSFISLISVSSTSTTEDAFISSCLKYFYKKTPPTGFPKSDNIKYICQRYKGSFYFATLYDIKNRIPLFSAYTVDDLSCDGPQPNRRDEWFIEPELAGRDKAADMETDKKSILDWVAPVQAINDDYKDTGFDRGHLNPNFMHCGSARVATFSLTNSVPQDACFNRIVWFDIESKTKERFETECAFSNANRYVITGAVPSDSDFIPQKDLIVDDMPDRVTERVNVPSHSWTMACCDASEATGETSYFAGHIGENRAGGKVQEFTDVKAMEKRLSELYKSLVTLLADGCMTKTGASAVVG